MNDTPPLDRPTVLDPDIFPMSAEDARAEAQRLRNMIRWFLTRQGQSMCWELYNDLGDALPEKLHPYPVPDKPLEMMAGCVRYCQFVEDARRRLSGEE